MRKVKIIRCKDKNRLEEDVNRFLSNDQIQVIDIKYACNPVANKYNSHGVPINVAFYDTAYICYEDKQNA